MSLAENEFTISYSRADCLATLYVSDKIIATRLISKGMIPYKTTKARGTDEITGWFFKLAPRDVIIKPLFQDIRGLNKEEKMRIHMKTIRLVPSKRADGVYLKDGLQEWLKKEEDMLKTQYSDMGDGTEEEVDEIPPEILAELDMPDEDDDDNDDSDMNEEKE